eukprot:2614-Eustigmatos_ZCMA.PRE.1
MALKSGCSLDVGAPHLIHLLMHGLELLLQLLQPRHQVGQHVILSSWAADAFITIPQRPSWSRVSSTAPGGIRQECLPA